MTTVRVCPHVADFPDLVVEVALISPRCVLPARDPGAMGTRHGKNRGAVRLRRATTAAGGDDLLRPQKLGVSVSGWDPRSLPAKSGRRPTSCSASHHESLFGFDVGKRVRRREIYTQLPVFVEGQRVCRAKSVSRVAPVIRTP